MVTADKAPLEDPDYEPVHRPVPDKPVPDVLGRWKPASQVLWFKRFREELEAISSSPASQAANRSRWYTESVEHKDFCCGTCKNGEESEYWDDPSCCCRSTLHSARVGRMGYTGWSRSPDTLFSHVPHLRCANPVVVAVEGYSPRETYHGSLDRRIYACEEHADLVKRKWLRGLGAYVLRLPTFETHYLRCGKIVDYAGIKP